jgi:hypothetical protein
MRVPLPDGPLSVWCGSADIGENFGQPSAYTYPGAEGTITRVPQCPSVSGGIDIERHAAVGTRVARSFRPSMSTAAFNLESVLCGYAHRCWAQARLTHIRRAWASFVRVLMEVAYERMPGVQK